MNPDLDKLVRQRARGRCEYCRMPAKLHPAPFQIDHVIARQHKGRTVSDNLALACIHCNRNKGPNIAGVDPMTGEIIRLFHPRLDTWSAHFTWSGSRLIGRTPSGRATIQVLDVNAASMVELREALTDEQEP